MTNLPLLYFARLKMPRSEFGEFASWYASDRAPRILEEDGFFSSQQYHAMDDGLVCNVYEIASSDIFYRPDYRERRSTAADPGRAQRLQTVNDRSQTAYEQVLTTEVDEPLRPWVEGSREGGVQSGSVTTFRFNGPAEKSDDDVIAWYRESELPYLAGLSGFQRARLCRRDARPHATNPSPDEPRWMVFVEWAGIAAADTQGGAEAIAQRHCDGIGAINDQIYDRLERAFSIVTPAA